MSAKAQSVLDPGELNATDEQILDLLHAGRVSPPFVASELDKSREYASERLIRLKEHGNARRIAPGLYELVADPRGEADADATEVDLDELRAAVADIRDAYEDVDGNGIDEALTRAETLLDTDR